MLMFGSIVAIHGIGANPEEMWNGRLDNGVGKINWLTDLTMLPGLVPAARIMRFGYESQWFGDQEVNTKITYVDDLAKRLLADLSYHRQVYIQSPVAQV